MHTFSCKHLPIAAAALLLSACASVPADLGFSDVQRLVGEHHQQLQPTLAVDAAALATLLRTPLDTDGAVRVALVNNPGLRAHYAGLGLAAAEVYEAGRLSNPTFSASVLDSSESGQQVSFGLAQSFAGLLMLPARKRLAAGEFERAQLEVSHQVLTLAADTEAAWYRSAGAQQIAALRQTIARAAEVSAQLAQSYFDAGNLSRKSLAQEQAAAAEAQAAALDAEAEARGARAELAALLGLPLVRQDWSIAPGLPLPPPQEDDAAALLRLAQDARLDLRAARREADLLADGLGVARRYRWLGEAEIGVERERETDGSRLFGPTLSLQLPIFSQGQPAVLRAQAHLQQAEARLRQLELDAGNGVQAAQERVTLLRQRAEQLRDTLIPLREQIVARTQEEVNYMLEGPFELLLAKQQEYDAYEAYLQALSDYWIARVELSRAVGARLPSTAQIGRAPAPAEAAPAAEDHSHHQSTPATAPGPQPAADPHAGHHMHREGMQMTPPAVDPHAGHHMQDDTPAAEPATKTDTQTDDAAAQDPHAGHHIPQGEQP